MPFKSRINWKEELPKIKELGRMGISMVALAERYGVSRQRIKQVLDKHIPEWHDCYGRVVNQKLREEAYYKKWGKRQSTDLYKIQRLKFSSKKAAAKAIGWEWTVEFGELLWPTHCPILGLELDYYAESAQENSPSFDQIEAGKGYVTGNVQIISWRANRIKSNGTAKEHRKIADYLDSIST